MLFFFVYSCKEFNMRIFVLILFIFSACFPQPKAHKIQITDALVEVQFGRKMPRTLLDSIKQLVAEKGIQLEYPVLKYDGELLSELEFTIQANGHTGSAATHFVYKGKPFGFRITNPGSAAFNMIVGDLPVK